MFGIGIGLEFVGWSMDTSTACQEEEEFAGGVGVVSGFCDVAFDVVEFGDFASRGLGRGGWFCDCELVWNCD